MMSAQLISIFAMFISGIAVGAVIDCTRIVLRQIPSDIIRYLTTFIEWLIWLFLGVCSFYLLFLIKGGEWRVVDPLAQLAGIIAYEFIFQKIARFIGRLIVNILIKPFLFICQLIIRLINNIFRGVVAIILFLCRPINKLCLAITAVVVRLYARAKNSFSKS